MNPYYTQLSHSTPIAWDNPTDFGHWISVGSRKKNPNAVPTVTLIARTAHLADLGTSSSSSRSDVQHTMTVYITFTFVSQLARSKSIARAAAVAGWYFARTRSIALLRAPQTMARQHTDRWPSSRDHAINNNHAESYNTMFLLHTCFAIAIAASGRQQNINDNYLYIKAKIPGRLLWSCKRSCLYAIWEYILYMCVCFVATQMQRTHWTNSTFKFSTECPKI